MTKRELSLKHTALLACHDVLQVSKMLQVHQRQSTTAHRLWQLEVNADPANVASVANLSSLPARYMRLVDCQQKEH